MAIWETAAASQFFLMDIERRVDWQCALVILEVRKNLTKNHYCMPKLFIAALINIYKIHVKVRIHETMIRNS